MTNSNRRTVVRETFAILAAAVVLFALAPPVDAAERSSTSTRSGSVSRSSIATKTSSGTTSSASRSGASATRSGGRSGGGTAHRGSSSQPSRRHYPSDYYRYSHRSYWGAYFGLYPWGYYGHYGHYGYPYYPIFPSLYYGPHPGDYRDQRLGALDINVKPKKAEVWVDGQLVGASGKFDGFPGYLWLARGRHHLIFHKPGFKTVAQEVRVLEGAVVRVNLRLEAGESVAPETLVKQHIGRRQRPARRAEAPRARAEAPMAEEEAPQTKRMVSVEPGRLLLSIEPGDASVYLDSRFLGTAEELSKLHAGLLVNAGQHTLEVVRPGFHAERMELVIEADTETSVSVELESG